MLNVNRLTILYANMSPRTILARSIQNKSIQSTLLIILKTNALLASIPSLLGILSEFYLTCFLDLTFAPRLNFDILLNEGRKVVVSVC